MKYFITTICLAGAALLGAAENLIKNPGFEQGGNWWFRDQIFSIQKTASNRAIICFQP